MSRIPGVTKEQAGPLVRATYAYSRRAFGRLPEPIAVTAHAPGLLAGYSAFEMATDRASRVDKRLKGLAEIKAALLAGCEWCVDFGSMLLDRDDVPPEQVRDLARHRDSDAFDEREKLVLDYAEAMTRTPVEVSDELFAALREHFDEGQLVELTSVIALENYRARFNWAFAIKPQGYADGVACAIPEPVAAA
jgi:AhpD family alkylhydroperoxidase